MKEKYGIENTDKSKNFTVFQLLNPNEKNEQGECNLEVRNRMKEAITSIIKNNPVKKIAIISHGAAIKFFLQDFCTYNEEKDCLEYNQKFICPRKLTSPSLVKINFCENEKNIYEIKSIKYEE